ncbi:MAG: response regulator [Desulfobacteraceae bacterium]|nr:response regulator [Desulfobacteraceae bacterium]
MRKEIEEILVLDSDAEVCELVKSFLLCDGYSCETATDPVHAFSALESHKIDLVIAGLELNGVDPLDFIRAVRRRRGHTDIIAMVREGVASPADIVEAGAVDFLVKPVRKSELMARIGRVCRERSSLRGAHDAYTMAQRLLAEGRETNRSLLSEIAERRNTEQIMHRMMREMESLVSSIPLILIELSMEGDIRRWNSVAERVFAISAVDMVGKTINDCMIPWEVQKIDETVCYCSAEYLAVKLNGVRFTRTNGKEGLLDLTVSPIREDFAVCSGIIILGTDVTEHRLLERQLVQAQKLESIGQLAAGIAHEINTPAQYVGDNTRFLQDVFGDLDSLLNRFEDLLHALNSGRPHAGMVEVLEEAMRRADIHYVRQEIPRAIQQSIEGIERISKIVRAMKEFSHPGTDVKTSIDLNKAIESTITVARNEWKYVADIATDFDPALPLVPCLPGEINQVFLNMLINAAHAIVEAQKQGHCATKGVIGISTRVRGEFVEVRISDTGTGIPPEIRSRIFDPFFTTKEVGKGTGQGLAISHSVVVDKHGGSVNFETEVGRGTTFIIRLPLESDSVK